MAIDAGDAVLRFLGDSRQLDAKFDELGPNTEKAFKHATEAVEDLGDKFEDTGKKAENAADDVEDAGKRTVASSREARAEVALLGEEFGIRLPRHVRSFVAELPGVGAAMEAAFSATAILFLAQALVQATDKVSNFIGSTLIYSAAMKEQTAEIIKENILIAQQSDLFRKAQASLVALSDERTPLQKLTDQVAALNKEYDDLASSKENLRVPDEVLQARARAITEELALLEKQIELQKVADVKGSDKKALAALKEQITLQKDLTLALVAYHQAENQGNDKSNYDEARFQVKLIALEKEKAAEEKYNKDNLAGIEALNNQIKVLMVERGTDVQEELNKERATLNATLKDMQADVKATGGIDIVLPQTVQNILTMQNAAHSLGITLRSDLVSSINTAISALDAYKTAGGTSTIVINEFKQKIGDLEKQLDQFGQTEDRLKIKTETTWKGFIQDLKQGADATHELSTLGQSAFNDLSKNIEGAFTSIVMGQGNVAQALEKATAASLAQIASQAAVKALFYTGEGFAALAGFNDSSAAAYFTAAGEMAAVAAVAGAAGHELAGAGGSSGSRSTAQSETSNSNTTQSNRSGGGTVSGVQQFASGGLVTGPTLAIIGEDRNKPTEAVLPLDDEQAMGKIREGIGGGAGGGVHFHLPHGSIISADTLSHLAAKMSKAVAKGQISLTASNSLRLTKRSA